MAENDQEQPPSTITAGEAAAEVKAGEPVNVVSEHTGRFDVRFLLWRMFCAETGVSIDSMPSELEGEMRDRWDKMKDSQLHKPAEDAATPPVTNG